jgi:hypothetical protein
MMASRTSIGVEENLIRAPGVSTGDSSDILDGGYVLCARCQLVGSGTMRSNLYLQKPLGVSSYYSCWWESG